MKRYLTCASLDFDDVFGSGYMSVKGGGGIGCLVSCSMSDGLLSRRVLCSTVSRLGYVETIGRNVRSFLQTSTIDLFALRPH
jgi:hypothetical protein